ncbi:hypothetical protein BOX15_Mlig007002g3 [Macrostomum lignano]|uniref:Uncharacterized protein n=1 Tax=Macrostomum lignano TaxID=282301 RepID=A0A267EDJ2_9PLAT|nr:hypothetical protein BOX15_Mlig007002g3 [Macrostomum lignano]
MYLCLSQNASLMAALGMNNFSFVSPPGVCVGCLVEKLCTVNIAALLQETNEFGTSLAGKWGSASKMSFVVLGDKAMQLQALVMQLAAKSSVAIPGMFQSANWNPALMLLAPKVANGAAILDSTQELLFTVYLSIKDPKAQAAFATLLSDVLGQWAPRLESFIATKNLYAMFKGLPILDALYNITAADGGTATLRVVLMASAYSPKKVAELILNPTAAADAFGKLCNGSLDLASLLVMDATEDTRSVQQALCSVFSDVENVNALTTRLVQQLGLSSLFGAPGSVGNASSTTNITAVQAQAQMFFQKLQALTATSSAGLLPQLNLAVYSELITYVTNGRPADQQMVLEYYTTLYTLLKTYLPAADFLRVQDVIASSMSFLKALLQYTGAAIQGPGSLELSNLVANISSAQTVLDQLLKPHNLTGLQVVTGKLAQLYILVMSNASILCSMDPNEYFVLPATLDAKALQDGLCRLSSNFQMEIMGNMDLMKLMQAVSSLAMPNKTVDFNLVWQFYGTLINQTALLARPRNVTYRGVLVSDLLQMTSPDLQKLFPDIITISGQLNLIFGVAETVATSLDSMISKDPVAATILKITHAALSTVQSILKSWAQAGELNLSVVFRNATLWTELFTNTTVGVGDISALVNVTLRVDKLAILFSKPMDIPSTICNSTNGFSTYFAIGAAVPALDKVFYYIFCDQAAQNRLRIEFLDQMGISAILEASATSGNGTSVSLKDAVAQVRQLVNQVGLVIQRPLVFNTNGTVIDSLIKLLGSDVIAQLGKLLQDQFAQPTAALNFLPPVLEAAYSLFKSSMPKETAQLDLGIAVAYEIIARTNAEVTNMLGKAITLETLLRPDNVLSPLLKSLDATDANTLTLLVRATLNNSEFNRWLAMGFTNALCKEDLNRLFVSTVPMNLSALQSSICTLANSSALMSALGSMFNDKNSLFEMLTTMTVRQSVSVTNMYTMILQLSGSLQGLGSVNSTALDAKILSMISSLQAGSAGLVANYKAYLTGSLSAMGQLTLRTGDLALLGAVAGKLEQSVGLLSAIHRMVTGQASPAAFVQILSAIVADQRLAATVVLARGAQPAVAEMCGKLNSVFPSAADAAAVNASFCQSPADAWWQAKISPTAADQIFVYLTGENATVTTLPWKTFEPTLTSVISLGELLTAAPATLSNVTIPTLLTALQQLSMQQTLGPTLAMIITQQVSSTDQAIMQRTLEISVMFMSVLLTAHRDNLTNALVQPGALNQLMLVSNSGYFRTELEVLLANPEYAMLSGGELNATLCDIDQFQTTLPYVRWSIAAQMMLSPNDTRVDTQQKSLQAYLCEGAQKDMLMLQQLEKFANLSKLIKLANSFKGMSIAKLMQELLSGNFSIAGVSQVFADPSGLLNVFTQLGQSLMMPMNSTSSGVIITSSLRQVCNSMQAYGTTLFVINGTAVKLLNELLATLTNNTSLIEAALCDLAVVDLAGAASKLTQLMKLAATPGRPSTLDCVSFANLFTSSRIGTCWSNQTVFFQKLAGMMTDYSMFVQLANQASQLQTLIGPEAASYLASIFKSISEGVKRQVTIQSLLANSTSSLDQFAKLLDTTKELFNQIIGSTIIFNSSFIASMSDADLYNALCSPTKISQIISFPAVLSVDMGAVSRVICQQMATSPADRQRILLLIRGATAPNFGGLDLSGWIRALTNLNNLLEQLNQLQGIRELLSNFDIRRMSEYESVILSLIRSFPGEQLQKIGYSLVKDLQGLSTDPAWASLMSDLTLFFKSLRLFDFAKPLFPIKLQVKDFVDDPSAVRQYLQRQGFPAEVSDLILSSYLSTEQLFNFSLKLSLPEALCNAGKLQSLIDFSNVTYNVSSLVEQLCVNRTLRDVENITETILKMGNFGRFFMKQFGQQAIDSLLNSSGVTLVDLKDAIQAVQDTGNALQNAFNVLQELVGVVASFNPGSSDMGSPNGLEGISQAVCGTSGKFNFTSVYGISLSPGSTDSGRRRKRRSTHSTTYTYELGQLASNEFCRNLYDLTQKSTAGRVGWTYVKPIIRGRVIVTPDTNTTRSLMSGAQEQFTKLFNLQELANSLAGLLPTATGTSAASVLANLLSNPLASSAFSGILGSSTNLTSMQNLLKVFTGNTTSNSSSTNQMLKCCRTSPAASKPAVWIITPPEAVSTMLVFRLPYRKTACSL